MGDLSWRFDEREYTYVKEVLDSGFASGTSGNMNTRLERAFAERFGMPYALTVSSGTAALHVAMAALGVGYGDEVILPALTVISCMNAVLYCNAVPVFADVDSKTFLLDPIDVRKKITPRTKAIMAVHLYGAVCNMTELKKIAEEFHLKLIEDCAECYLGTHHGNIAGTMSDVGCWSFENSKHLTTGDGGILACRDEPLADRIRKLSAQGYRNATAVSGKVRLDKSIFQNPEYKRHDTFAYMYRLPEVAAALGLAQLSKLDWFVGKREQMARMYLDAIGTCPWIQPQKASAPADRNTYWTFAMRMVHDDIPWQEFRKKHVEYGGDGIYAAWSLLYQEDSIADIEDRLSLMGLGGRMRVEPGLCPNAEAIQPQLMQLTTNQKDEAEMRVEAEALRKTIEFFS